ncbi:hypothetical protein [Chlamydia buteonis]|uniref:hypothetical protein n=1 Tax=Chlamydia buteonis TaxID=2494525 RepID=UPI00344CDF71
MIQATGQLFTSIGNIDENDEESVHRHINQFENIVGGGMLQSQVDHVGTALQELSPTGVEEID